MVCLKCPSCKSSSLLEIYQALTQRDSRLMNQIFSAGILWEQWYILRALYKKLIGNEELWLFHSPKSLIFHQNVATLPSTVSVPWKHILEVNIRHMYNYQAHKWTTARFRVPVNLCVLFLMCNTNKAFQRGGEASIILLSISFVSGHGPGTVTEVS